MRRDADTATIAFRELTPDEVLDAVEGLGFRCNGRLLALNSYENRVYQVGVEDGRRDDAIVAKFYRPVRWSDEAILEEHDFAAELDDAGILLVAPMRIGGRTLHRCGAFRVALFPRRGGRAPELDDFRSLEQLGRLVARIHRVGETADFEHRPAIGIESHAIEPREYLLDEGFVPDELCEVYEGVTEDAIRFVEAAFERAGDTATLRLHGDFHPGNVLTTGEAFHIVDLDDARSGPAVQDLWMFLSGDRNEQTPQLEALLEGYETFRRFDARELHLVEALRTLRIMHYAAWLARRWEDPAFRIAFPWFESRRYWDEHVLAIREQLAAMQEMPLAWLVSR